MKAYPSSIFSFDTLRPNGMPKGWLASILIVLCLVVGAELVARVISAPLGDNIWAYWDDEGAQKFEWYREMALDGEVPAVVVVGDSLAARNFDPAAFTSVSGVSSYNLGWPGMFPLAFDKIVPHMLEEGTAPRHLIIMQSPTSYVENDRVRRNEAGVVNSIIARRLSGETIAADYMALARIYEARSELVSYWLKGQPLVQAPPMKGFMPHRRPADPSVLKPDPGDIPTGDFAPQRLAVMERLIDLARERDIQLITIISPMAFEREPHLLESYRSWLLGLADQAPDVLTVWDMTETEAVSIEDYKDFLHFWHDGAGKFSGELGQEFKERSAGL